MRDVTPQSTPNVVSVNYNIDDVHNNVEGAQVQVGSQETSKQSDSSKIETVVVTPGTAPSPQKRVEQVQQTQVAGQVKEHGGLEMMGELAAKGVEIQHNTEIAQTEAKPPNPAADDLPKAA